VLFTFIDDIKPDRFQSDHEFFTYFLLERHLGFQFVRDRFALRRGVAKKIPVSNFRLSRDASGRLVIKCPACFGQSTSACHHT
jgi:hypothetical protein